MGSYWAKVVSYPTKVAPAKAANVVLDWEAGYGEWLVPNAEVYFKFKLAGETLLTTPLIKADGPGNFAVPIPATVVAGEELNLSIEYWDKDLIKDDLIQSLILNMTVDTDAAEGGDEFDEEDDGADGALDSTFASSIRTFVEKWAAWLTAGLLGISVLIMWARTGSIDWTLVLIIAIMGVVAWAIIKYWKKYWYIGAGLYVFMPIISFFSEKFAVITDRVASLGGGLIGGL